MNVPADPDDPIPEMNARYQAGRIPDHRGFEYVDGTWVERPGNVWCSHVGAQLLTRLHTFGEESGLGHCFSAGLGYRCFPEEPLRVRKSSVSSIADGRLSRDAWNAEFCPIPPDFAAEVVPPNVEARFVNRRVHDYFSVGVRLFWLIYPNTKTVWIFRANGSGAWVAGAGELSGEDVIPGFTITLETLFSED